MKRLFIMAAAVVAIVSCKEATPTGPEYYFDKEVSRLYNDPTAEMDTLSYAAGMNLGLVMSLQNADFDIDTEAIIAGLDKELKSAVTDQKRFDKVNEYMTEYSTNIVSPYMRTKQMNSRIVTDRPDTLSLPELYNETYTREAFADALVVIFADGMRKQRLPINLHWAYQAIRDAKAVESKEDIDHLARGKQVTYIEPSFYYAPKYAAAYDATLTDGKRGTWTYADERWQGFLGRGGVDVIIDMEEVTTIRSISADFMQICGPGVFMPCLVEIAVSTDGENYTKIADIEHEVILDELPSFKRFGWEGEVEARYIRYKAHRSKYTGFLFVDEIVVR